MIPTRKLEGTQPGPRGPAVLSGRSVRGPRHSPRTRKHNAIDNAATAIFRSIMVVLSCAVNRCTHYPDTARRHSKPVK